jgi:hypothetical protein
MKKILVAVSLLFSTTVFAQNCMNYYLLQNNKTIEMTIYNKKGEPGGKQVYSVSGLSTSAGATTATIKSEMFDKKGKSLATSTNNIKCSGGVMMMNMKMMLPQQQQEQLGKTEATAESVYIEYPAGMAVGDNLKDANFTMDMNTSGMQQSVTMNITDRKVEGKEKITTSAGSWDCYKITYKARMAIKTMGIGIPINMNGTEWFAPGFGVVKTQSNYGGTEITAIH